MSWVKNRLQAQKPSEQVQEKRHSVNSITRQAWEVAFEKIVKTIEGDVLEFNQASRSQYSVSKTAVFVHITPQQNPMDTVVIQIDPSTGIMQFDCPISHPGIPRRGEFNLRDGNIRPHGNFVGPPPNSAQMTPDEVSEFILGPLLFPEPV